MEYVMVRKDKAEANKALEEYSKTQENNDLARIKIDPERINICKQEYVIEEETYNKNYHLHNYTEVSPDIPSFNYNGVNYSE
jgi:stress response protein YsnF